MFDFGTILSYARKIRKGLRRLACAKVKGHAEFEREIMSRVEVFISPQITHHSSPVLMGTYTKKVKRVRVSSKGHVEGAPKVPLSTFDFCYKQHATMALQTREQVDLSGIYLL